MKLTQEQIEKIRKRSEYATRTTFRNHAMVSNAYVEDIPALLAHIERLDRYIIHLGEQVESDKQVKSGYYNENKMLKQRIAELESKVNSESKPVIGFSECDEFDKLMEAMNDDEE